MKSTDNDDLLLAGHVNGVHGIKGWVKVFSNTIPREQILSFSLCLVSVEGELLEFEIKGKKQGKLVIAHLAGCDDRNKALEFVECEIYIHKSQLPKLDEGDYYWSDLEGLQVKTLEGEHLGTVDHLIETGANDVMVVQGDKEHLIPYVRSDIVKNIDLQQGVMQVDWQKDY